MSAKLVRKIREIYDFTLEHPVPNQTKKERKHMSDTISELASIQTYAQASSAWITAASALIAQLESASSSNPTPTDSDSPDVETAIQNILAFQTANPVPAVPVAPVTTTPVATPSASSIS